MPVPSRVLSAGNSGLATVSICGDGAVGLVAVGSTQATALQLSAVFNTITTSSASTGVKLPPCEAGAVILIYNLSGQTLQIYSTDVVPTGTSVATINAAVAGSTGVQLGNTKTAICFGTSATTWVVAAALSST